MERLTDEQLTILALHALEEAVGEAKLAPVRRTRLHRLSLAYLASRCPQLDRRAFDLFWRDLAHDNAIGRGQSLNACLEAIYRMTGNKRDHARCLQLQVDARSHQS